MLLLVLWRYWRHWIQICSPISGCENAALPLSAPPVRACYGTEWYGMEYGMEGKNRYGIWNGRKKSVWNMEWLKYGMEDLIYGMEQIFHIPYKFHTCTF